MAPVMLKEYAHDYYDLNPITSDMYSYMLSLAKYKGYTPKFTQPTDKNTPISPCVIHLLTYLLWSTSMELHDSRLLTLIKIRL